MTTQQNTPDLSAHGFLEEASETMKARAKLRDAEGGERSMARTVAIFNAWTGNNLSEEDGWRFMIALKQAREIQGKFNRDDYVDMAAYTGLLGECESNAATDKRSAGLDVQKLIDSAYVASYLQGSMTKQVQSYETVSDTYGSTGKTDKR
ncbi:MAG TPA: DUF6378 domain-containing protein [Methanosarcina sp.]|nr:DUF6378 domain-containing protein [Methanosarcina sp.]